MHEAAGNCWRQAVRAAHLRRRVLPGLRAEMCAGLGAGEGEGLVLCAEVGGKEKEQEQEEEEEEQEEEEQEEEEESEREEASCLRARISAAVGATNWPRSQPALALPELLFPRKW